MAPTGSLADVSRPTFDYIYHHLFLPRQLPGADDASPKGDASLLDFIHQSLERFLPGRQDETAIKASISMIDFLRKSRSPQGHLKEAGVREVLQELLADASVAVFHITDQNAGVLISKKPNTVCFETFELSPTNEAAMSTRGRLLRQFPGNAVEVPLGEFKSDAFRGVLVKTLTKMSQQPLRETTQVPDKERPNPEQQRPEQDGVRETADPKIVTELFTSMLRGCGNEVAVEGICKHTREDIVWKSGRLPWRRSSLWLLIRVALHLSMARLSGGDDRTYKEFMAFLMAETLQIASHQQKIASDVLQTMLTKVSRRLCKIRLPSHGPWLSSIRKIVADNSETLHQRWKTIREREESPLDLAKLSEFRMEESTDFSLVNMEKFLDTISSRRTASHDQVFHPASQTNEQSQDQIPLSKNWKEADSPFSLFQIESWVADNLSSWVDQHLRRPDTCVQDLKLLVEFYHAKATIYYSGRPEGASRMILTIADLWCAADTVTVHEIPLLANYLPPIPTMVWQALLLSSKQEMQRLKSLEDYMLQRQKNAEKLERPSIFGSFGLPGSFAVEFFSKSEKHQEIKYEIESDAARTRQEKREEFRKTKAEYISLMQKHAAMDCDVVTKKQRNTSILAHPSSCKRCRVEAKAKALGVQIHEWPLPRSDLEAQAAVFEMAAPTAFSEWRDLTIYFINDVLLSQPRQSSSPSTTYALRTYQPVKPWYTSHGHSRIHLRSEDQPNSIIHKRAIPIESAAESDVCLDSGLLYRYFDEKLNAFFSKLVPTDKLTTVCTFKFPPRAESLIRYHHRSWKAPDGESPNEVITSQYACPEWLPLSEFKALAGLPYGHSIQWMSILSQLAMPKVDFNRPETATFILQMCLQSGPQSAVVQRSTHSRLCDPIFGRKLLESLKKCVSRVGENWESYIALWSFTSLATRALSLAPANLSQSFLGLLQKSRETTHKWVQDLLQKAEDTSNEEERKELLETAFNLALVCSDSFNVYDGYLSRILQDSAEASILVECSIIINDNAALKKEDGDILQGIMLDRWRHLMYRARPILTEQNVQGQSFLSDATQRRWRYFKRDCSWTMSPKTDSWYQTSVVGMEVHLNILTGELLANGMPLSRLPVGYQLHDDYKRVFRDLLLHVMPSMAPGMAFCTTHLLYGYTVHFGLQGKDLLIRLENDDSCFDYVPPRVFQGSLPDAFVHDYVHWYNNKTDAIEFFSHKHPYPIKRAEWCLGRDKGPWKLCQNDTVFLLTPASGFSQHLSSILAHLESPLNLHMLFNEEKSLLEIQVPRLQLRFFMHNGESVIRSQQFRDMQIDADQSIGTLVGLRSKLVLRSSQDPPKRMLIVPEGQVEFRKQGSDGIHDHVAVTLQFGTARRVQAYQVDELLGRFVANTKLESKLYLAYVHALTSFCLPDPLLGRRGLEESMNILCSASVRAPTVWSPGACQLMKKIAVLAPARHYHPEGSKAMQTVVWSTHLSSSSQDDRLFTVTQQISQQSSVSDFLYPKAKARTVSEPHTTLELAQRAISRDCSRVSSNPEDERIGSYYVLYHARDRSRSDRAVRATEVATRAFRGDRGPSRLVAAGLASHLYRLMSTGKLSNHRGAPSKRDMEYDSMWLQKPDAWLSSYWCQLHSGFQQNQEWLPRMELVAWISTVAYSTENDVQITQALLMLALSPTVAAAPLPAGDAHDLSRGFILEPAVIEASAAFKTNTSARNGADVKGGARTKKPEGKNGSQFQKDHGKDKRDAVNIYREKLTRQWPCQAPKPPSDFHMEAYIDVARAMKSVLPPWKMWWANMNFKEYLAEFTTALQQLSMTPADDGPFLAPTVAADYRTEKNVLVIDIFCRAAPNITSIKAQTLENLVQKVEAKVGETEKLAQTIDILDTKTSKQYEQKYLNALRQSLSSFKTYSSNHLAEGKEFTSIFQQHLAQCMSRYGRIYTSLLRAVQPFSISEPSSPDEIVSAVICMAGFQPRISPIFFLQQLKGANWSKLSVGWKDAIVEYGLAISALQKAKRLIRFQNDPVDLLRELENGDHTAWNPHEYPEWLLLECESDIMIRPTQTQIARQMIQPPNGHNAVMQLNMGEGKSSVIVPIVSTALADGTKLVRVIAAKAQAKQMLQMLVAKLSGLLDRPVYQLPFSRDVRLDTEKANAIHQLLAQCQKEGGVLLVQPEHLLSLQLMELELELSGHSLISQKLTQIRKSFDYSSRDIVDESDENFSVKFELTYTLGQQQALEHSPYRWIIVQEVLSLARRFAAEVATEFPLSMEFDNRRGERFPRIRILRQDAEQAMFDRIADFICETGMTGFPIARQPPKIRNAARNYITKLNLSAVECQDVEHSQFWNESTANHILLLRGLLAGGVLAFALGRKRWRVNYGLDPTREKNTRLAVPYQAKDSPSARSEFSHPDIVIVLTCLTYYYGGLDDQAIFDSLELLVRSDNAELEYSAWVQTAPTLPQAYRLLQGVNLRDRVQCLSAIFPHLRYSKGAIDYYLCRMVFNKSCQEFPHKLSASGWDLGKTKRCPTTGFSGTNDSRYVLPLGVKQLDLVEQSHTNALVLSNLLRPENSIATMPEEMVGTTFDSQSLLTLLLARESKPRVILDVGAQIIDRTNVEMARAWLGHYDSDENTQAVIFFNDWDEMMVLDKSGQIDELQTSPFADRLEQCLVFLDEVHTRGTDLRLPADYQAVVTLGAQVTKDRLAQACMRMRKLGRGQSVVFFVPREIEHDIGLLRGDQVAAMPEITVSDVLCWAITETCKDLRRAVPLWLNQGLRFTKQQALWADIADPEGRTDRLECAKQFMDEESQSLEKRYRPKQGGADIASLIAGIDTAAANEFQSRCLEFGLDALPEASFNEEQERELSPEKEMERRVERPPRVEPAEHRIHPGLHDFITNGVQTDAPFLPAFTTLKATSAAHHLEVAEFPLNILVTQDFAATVRETEGPDANTDAFQKPVQWILSTQKDASILVIVSPYEVQQLLSVMEQSSNTTLHIYAPRVNLGHEPLDTLDLYQLSQVRARQAVSRHATSCLGLFAGQLYLSSFSDYVQLCDALGLAWKPANDEVLLGPDGFIPPGMRGGGDIVNRSGFSKSPVRFLTVLIAKIRLDSEHFDKTHMGRILAGVRLLKSDFESA